ncbi:MAG: thioredoxin family protein [Rhodospirillales bacterium]|nr:thioredoxin family protein [Rhodospirillales bacterium]
MAFAIFSFFAIFCADIERAEAAELVMFESHGCEWCELWNEEIGAIYGKTSEAKIIPLRRVDIGDDRPSDLKHLGGLVYTPTFIVMQKGKEVGRIIGYPGEDFFWQLLNEIIVSKGLRATNGS